MTEDIKAVSYCVGMSIAGSLMQQDLDGISPEVLAEATCRKRVCTYGDVTTIHC